MSLALKVAWLSLLASSDVVEALVPGPWSDRSAPADERSRALVANMTLDEKISILHGPPTGPSGECANSSACAYVGNIAPISRLGMPPVNMNDGPQGFRDDRYPGSTVAWPSGLTIAASWDPNAAFQWGAAMGKEFYDKGANVQLGPGINVARVPRNGRNFEYISGEDPILGSKMVASAVKGIQSKKVVANAKHWVLNNQETARGTVSSEADERTRFEMYYPPFVAASDAGIGSFMCSYNKINDVWSCENPETLARDLKQVIGFRGYVMSDWGATHSTSIMQGLDVEMPGATFFNAGRIKPALDAGTITEAAIDDSVRRILLPMFEVGVMDEPLSAWDWNKLELNVVTPENILLAEQLSSQSTVLLKNEGGILPLSKYQSIAVLGLADAGAVYHGGGSGKVVASNVTSPLSAIRAAALEGNVVFNNGTDIAAAAATAAVADVAIVFAGTISREGGDRVSLSLDDGCTYYRESGTQCLGNTKSQNALINAVAAANRRTVVVLSVPGAILTPWAPRVAAIITNFLPGQGGGAAIAKVLFGEVNPSGKLPITFPNVENETAFSQEQWPGVPDPRNPQEAFYTEHLLVGYRYYDAHDIKFTTGFPFGHGVSYTSFAYSNLQISAPTRSLTFQVRNSGPVAGAEVAQLYISFPASAGEPIWQLKEFSKTNVLGSGDTQSVTFTLSSRDLSIWNSKVHAWQLVTGTFLLKIGSSSQDVRLQGSLIVEAEDDDVVEKIFV